MTHDALDDVPGIGRDEIEERQANARRLTDVAGYDALLVVGRSFYDRPGDLAYLTNHFPPFPTTVFSEQNRGMGHAFFLLPVKDAPTLLTDARKHRADLVAVDDVRSAADLGQAVIDLLEERGLARGRVGLVGDDILPAAFDRGFASALPGLQLEPERSIVAGLRAIKSPTELALMRRAALCADAALMTAVDLIKTGGVTERDVCAAAFAAGLLAGADFLRYVRVHSGEWSAAGSRWPQAMDRAIAPGEIVALDAIGAYRGYQFDVNRTTVAGTPDDASRELLETVLAATNAGVAACIAGTRVRDVVAASAAVIHQSPYADRFGGTMGHGIGLETVELPYLSHDVATELRPGMTLCVEPSLFIPGWAGAAIEQEVIIRESGPPEVITVTPTRLW